MHFFTPDWELALLHWINSGWRSPLLDAIMPVLSAPGFLWLTALVAVVLVGRFHPTTILASALSLGLTIAATDQTCYQIKHSVQRARPYHAVPGTWYLDSGVWKQLAPQAANTSGGGSSYPSAHAANAAAAAVVLYTASRYKSIWAVPFLVGLSRIYLGKHFPMDVLMGWLTGLAVALLLQPVWPELFKRARSRWIRYKLRI